MLNNHVLNGAQALFPPLSLVAMGPVISSQYPPNGRVVIIAHGIV